MTLGFKQEINRNPTYFAEKIINGLDIYDYQIMTLMDLLGDLVEPTDEQFMNGSCNPLYNHAPKLHTIRDDPKDNWKAGKLIHPVINNRTANRFQFAPVMKCVSTQIIVIEKEIDVFRHYRSLRIIIDGHFLNNNEIEKLAINDGFVSIEAFLAYFSKDSTRKIIHWTNLKY